LRNLSDRAEKGREKFARIIVSDTGIGISKEDQEKIFNRFFRVDKARSREQGGSGLGLSICKWIVEAHQGEIKVESELGKGSSFIVKFPSLPLE
jgi:signal transduction histidine kinase